MSKHKDETMDGRLPWFVADRPITTTGQDAFSHATVAATLSLAVSGSQSGAIVGLMGPFGSGKTSVANLTGDELRRVHGLDVVHVSADKHSGQARSRNIVHSVAGAMVAGGLVEEHDVRAILRRLRGADSIAVPEPEQMRLVRLFRDPRDESLRDIWTTLIVTVVIFALLLGLSVWLGHRPATLLQGLAAAALALGAMKVAYDHIIDSLFEIPKRTESIPRAEAADDVEIVFAQLVSKHADRRKKGLVVFVDDIDRLGEADLLDAMRSIKSLQAVPQGNEPRFVVSCDETVLLKALKDAATTTSDARALDSEAGIAREPTGAEDTARDYLDKFFHLRIEMPPNVYDDMPNLVQRLIPAGHPLRDQLTEDQVERVLLVLARGEVRSPRRLIHRTNGFLAAFKMARDREVAGATARLHPGDVTGRPVTLARLAVLAVDFPSFYADLMRDEGLLGAADRLARREDRSPTDEELLAKYNVESRSDWETLRRYLISTFRSVERSETSIVPLLYLAEPESGRTLGNEQLASILGAVRSGDAPRVESELAELPEEYLELAAAEITSMLEVLTTAETRDAVSGAVAALGHLGAHAAPVAMATAEHVHGLGAGALRPPEFRQLLDHLPADSRAATLRTLAQVPDGEPDDATNERMLVAGRYLVDEPAAVALPEAVTGHLDGLHERMGWQAAAEWIAIGQQLDRSAQGDLVDGHLVPAMYRLARGDDAVTFDDTAEGLLALVRAMESATRGNLQDEIRNLKSVTDDLAKLIVATFDAGYPATNVNDALRLSDALGKNLGDLEASAVRHLVASTATWKDSTFARRQDEPEDAPPRYCAATIGAALAGVVSRAVDAPVRALAEGIATLAASELAAAAVAEQMVETISALPDDREVSETIRSLAAEILATPGEGAITAGDRILSWFADTGELSAKFRSLLPLLDVLAANSAARQVVVDEAAAWRNAASNPSSPFPRSRPVEALARLAVTDQGAAEEATDGALQPLTTRIQQGMEIAQNLSVIMRLPWGAARTSEALALVESHLDQVGDITEVVPLALRAATHGVALPETMQQRLGTAVIDDPASLMPQFARMASAFDEPTRRRVVVATAGASDTTAGLLASMDATELAAVLVDAMKSGRAAAIADAAPADRLPGAAAEALRGIVDEGVAVDHANVQALRLPGDVVTALQGNLVDAVDDEHARARAALSMLTALGVLSDEFVARLDTVAVTRLEGWTEETAGLYADLRRGLPMPDDLREVVKTLMASEDDEHRKMGLRVRGRGR